LGCHEKCFSDWSRTEEAQNEIESQVPGVQWFKIPLIQKKGPFEGVQKRSNNRGKDEGIKGGGKNSVIMEGDRESPRKVKSLGVEKGDVLRGIREFANDKKRGQNINRDGLVAFKGGLHRLTAAAPAPKMCRGGFRGVHSQGKT